MIEYKYRPEHKFPHVLILPYYKSGYTLSEMFSVDSSNYRPHLSDEIKEWVDENMGVELIDYHIIRGGDFMEFRMKDKSKAFNFKLLWGV